MARKPRWRTLTKRQRKGKIKIAAKDYITNLIRRQGVRSLYDTKDWKELRVRVLAKFKKRCCACGIDSTEKQIHVDHIKPLSIYPELSLSFENLQLLCIDCNQGKSNKFDYDFR